MSEKIQSSESFNMLIFKRGNKIGRNYHKNDKVNIALLVNSSAHSSFNIKANVIAIR